jgi:hypothetical protein
LRFNIIDLGWTELDWREILALYPYRNLPESPQIKAVENTTGSQISVLRADWFAETASRAPLYNTLLRLPKTFAELQTMLRVDVAGDIEKFDVMRAGLWRW